MQAPIFITGNQNKANYLQKLIGLPIDHQKVDVDEIQSLDVRTVVEHKVRQAYQLVKKPVLVEDVGLTIDALGRLPGPFVKWFIEDVQLEGICRLADITPERLAHTSCCYGYFDGRTLKLFYAEQAGAIAMQPRGDGGFGWDPIFIPQGETLTLGEMTPEQFEAARLRIKPIQQVAAFLQARGHV